MSFIRPDLKVRLRTWREAITWTVVAVAGVGLIWHGYATLAPLSFLLGLGALGVGLGLLLPALRRLKFNAETPAEGMVVIDEARIAYLGPRGGGFVDLPSVARVEIVTRPHIPPASAHAWVITSEDGERLTIPLGAQGADGLLDALSPLPGINFDAGVSAMLSHRPGRAVVWRKAG
jgi:hypothetical protein